MNDGTIILTAAEQITQFDKYLDEFEKELNLEKIQKYLDYSTEELEKLMPEDCSYAVYTLNSFCFFIQKKTNKDFARLNYILTSMKSYLAPKLDDYKGYSYDERLNKAIQDDSHTRKLNTYKEKLQGRIDRVYKLVEAIREIANAIRNIQYLKVNHKNE